MGGGLLFDRISWGGVLEQELFRAPPPRSKGGIPVSCLDSGSVDKGDVGGVNVAPLYNAASCAEELWLRSKGMKLGALPETHLADA